jgi:hypothetical protein
LLYTWNIILSIDIAIAVAAAVTIDVAVAKARTPLFSLLVSEMSILDNFSLL